MNGPVPDHEGDSYYDYHHYSPLILTPNHSIELSPLQSLQSLQSSSPDNSHHVSQASIHVRVRSKMPVAPDSAGKRASSLI